MANGDLIKLGTLYLNGYKLIRPLRPWQIDYIPPGTSSYGDIPLYSTGQSIEIRDTDINDAYKIQWREANIDGKKLLICDRVLLTSISWDELNSHGLIFGKTVTIDGQQYKLRVLTGGSNKRNPDDFSGGFPIDNEWDRIIANESNINGLPVPSISDLDKTPNATDLNSQHNQFWNWYYTLSWCQDTYNQNNSFRSGRGYYSPKFYSSNLSSGTPVTFGWRPVLETISSLTLTLKTQNGSIIQDNKSFIHFNKNDFLFKIMATEGVISGANSGSLFVGDNYFQVENNQLVNKKTNTGTGFFFQNGKTYRVKATRVTSGAINVAINSVANQLYAVGIYVDFVYNGQNIYIDQWSTYADCDFEISELVSNTLEYSVELRNSVIQPYTICTNNQEFTYTISGSSLVNGANQVKIKVRQNGTAEVSRTFNIKSFTDMSLRGLYNVINS